MMQMKSVELEVITWYEDNQDWLDEYWVEKLVVEHGYDVSESGMDLMIPDDELEELFDKFNTLTGE